MRSGASGGPRFRSLNESPSEKEGKLGSAEALVPFNGGLNESPSEKEGKFQQVGGLRQNLGGLNESPSEKEGKWEGFTVIDTVGVASMKAPPKRKGNGG